MTKFSVHGSVVMLQNELDINVPLDKLPVATYEVCFNPKMGYYLQRMEDFTLPKKLYGSCVSKAERFLSTFAQRPNTTGILLSGEKGSGKSLVMKKTSILGQELGYPTLVVNNEFCGPDFNKFVAAITQPCVILFDEFEKIYSGQAQELMLTLLDGTYQSKKLVILTVNQAHKINENMINRPGRLFYSIKYTGLEQQFIVEYCNDNLKDKTKIDKIIQLSQLFGEFNFDMLQALVEELNRYNEDVKDVIQILNVKPDATYKNNYDVLILNRETGEKVHKDNISPYQIQNPILKEQVDIYIDKYEKRIHDETKQEYDHFLGTDELIVRMTDENTKINTDLSEIRFSTEKYDILIKKIVSRVYDVTSIL